MRNPVASLALSPDDRERIGHVDQLAEAGKVDKLLALLTEPSWAVRRSVVAALAHIGDPAVAPLCRLLRNERESDDRLAAAMNALAASLGTPEGQLLELVALVDQAPVVCDAAQVLGRRRSVEAMPAMGRLVQHPDDNVALAAIEAIGRIGAALALDPLLALLEGENFFRIFPAIQVLGGSGDPRAVDPLLRLLERPFLLIEAARALGLTGDLAAAAPLARLLAAPAAAANQTLTKVIAVSLVEIHARANRRFGSGEMVEKALRAAARAEAAGKNAAAKPPAAAAAGLVQRLSQAVPRAPAKEQAALCALLAWLEDEAAATALVDLVEAAPDAATAALRTVGSEGDRPLVKGLAGGDSARRALLLPLVGSRPRSNKEVRVCLSDPDVAVRILACEAVARLGEAAALPRLFELLGDSDPMMSQAALGAILLLNSDATESLALEAASSSVAHVRRSALRIIAYFGYASGLKTLIAAASGSDDRLRDAALPGLAFIDDAGALEVLFSLSAQGNVRARSGAMRALGQTRAAPEVLQRLRKGLADPEAWVRYYACQSLGRLRDASATEAILSLTSDPAGQVRVAAVDALAHLASEAALEGLREAAASDDPDVRRVALLGLGMKKRAEAFPVLLAAASSADAGTRLIALSAIAAYDSLEVVPALAAAASDPEESVRSAAIGFLGSRRDATSALIALLDHPLARDRALDELGAPIEGRISGIASALLSAERELALSLAAALARINRPEALAVLVDALSERSVEARRASASALAAIGTRDARAALERALSADPDPEVRRSCLLGLQR
jgi:HEAT repeat protein